MIQNIIDLLTLEDYYGVDKNIDIAKGMYSIPYNWKQGKAQIKRIWKSK
jgi:hypothetical protein